ncbi:MAG TPA: crotonase/enoyl-CoA hydratase family protein [Frankiaceae bacterium]|nr:crotonase/enoyl-CoA hydratase family protein [Frankiaceae bacterium]
MLDVTREGPVTVVTIDRPDVRNAVDGPTAAALLAAFEEFDADEEQRVAVLTGAGGTFCAGADLKAMTAGVPMVLDGEGPGPMGPSRLVVSKPTIAAVEGYAVAGGLELALWCDLRVAAADAVFGVYCRRWGVPLIDGGTVRLPRIVGQGRALDMVLTGRGVSGEEAVAFGLVTRLVSPGTARENAIGLANELAALPQMCLRSDRASVYAQWDTPLGAALTQEHAYGMATLSSGETLAGASRFVEGEGRHGS